MSQFFLSYRRDDSAGFAGRLADRLEAAFGAGSVFRDVDDIRPGEDFQTAIHDQLAAVEVRGLYNETTVCDDEDPGSILHADGETDGGCGVHGVHGRGTDSGGTPDRPR